MIEITLPWPPSVNTYWRTFRGRMIISAKGREYREAVGRLLVESNFEKCVGKVKVDIVAYRPDNRRRDLDNLLKAPLDVLTHAKVWEDDSLISDLRIRWSDEIGGMLKVTIEKLGEPNDQKDK